MIRSRAGIQFGCIVLCGLMAAAGPVDAVLRQAASAGDVERLEQALFGPEDAPESEMRRRVAWALLGTGRDLAALRQFARLAGRDPGAGGPKIGYALSAARLGDLTNAARAMRRVLRVDPNALAAVPIDSLLRVRLESLRTQYMKRLARFDHDRDGAVMLAAVCCLIGETDTARYSIGYLMANGERGPTTENLNKLIHLMENPPVPEPSAELIEVAAARPPVEDPSEEPLDFTLVYHDARENAPEPPPAPEPNPAPVPVPISAVPTTEVGESLNVQPPAEASPEASPTPVAVHEVTERYAVDYDVLRANLGSVGGALDSFTRKLIRNIAALQQE